MITVLMSVYHKENHDFLDLALNSLVNQTIPVKEVVIVKDGLLTKALDEVIVKYKKYLNLKIISLPQNLGLANALNRGLREINNPWVMRFDSDDICYPNRIELQTEIAKKNDFDLFGAQIEEFVHESEQSRVGRVVPTSHSEIIKFAKRRNPFNHMTVCYRRSLIDKVGGYPNIPYMEDYALWVKMILAGARVANDSSPLVRARVGMAMMARRGGINYIRSEFNLQKFMVQSGFKKKHFAVLDFFMRSFVFLMPNKIRALIYKAFLRDKLQQWK